MSAIRGLQEKVVESNNPKPSSPKSPKFPGPSALCRALLGPPNAGAEREGPGPSNAALGFRV